MLYLCCCSIPTADWECYNSKVLCFCTRQILFLEVQTVVWMVSKACSSTFSHWKLDMLHLKPFSLKWYFIRLNERCLANCFDKVMDPWLTTLSLRVMLSSLGMPGKLFLLLSLEGTGRPNRVDSLFLFNDELITRNTMKANLERFVIKVNTSNCRRYLVVRDDHKEDPRGLLPMTTTSRTLHQNWCNGHSLSTS